MESVFVWRKQVEITKTKQKSKDKQLNLCLEAQTGCD